MAAARKPQGQRRRRGRQSKKTSPMVFARMNYILLVAGVLVVVAGYAVMRLENEVDGFISLYVAPLMILGGYLEVIYAIFYREKPSREMEEA